MAWADWKVIIIGQKKRNSISSIFGHPSFEYIHVHAHIHIYIYIHVCIQKHYHVFPVWRELLKNSRHLEVVWAVLWMTNEDFPGSSILLDVRQSEMDTSERLQRGTLVLGCCVLRTTHEISPKELQIVCLFVRSHHHFFIKSWLHSLGSRGKVKETSGFPSHAGWFLIFFPSNGIAAMVSISSADAECMWREFHQRIPAPF